MKFKDEQSCRDWLAGKRWGGHDKAICPHCNHKTCYIHTGIDRYTCQSCAKQFSVRTNTIFEDSRLPLVKWFIAIYLSTSLKKGISSIQLSKYIEITQKSAWFMLQRIREVMKNDSDEFGGINEIDEAYIGGKYENMHKSKKETKPEKEKIGLETFTCRDTFVAANYFLPYLKKQLIKLKLK